MVRVAMLEHMDRSTGYATRLFGFVDAQLGCCSLGYLQVLCIISVFVQVERQKPVASLSAFKCVFDCMAFVSWSSSRVLSWFFFPFILTATCAIYSRLSSNHTHGTHQ
jgi:hypothetical protein